MSQMDYIGEKEWGKIFATAWRDPEFLNEFEKDPIAAVEKRFKDDPSFAGKTVFQMPPKPDYLTDVDVEEIQAGECLAIPYSCYCC